MKNQTHFDVIVIGGSYSGLSAAMVLGRSLKQVLIIDSGKPCNRQTPHSHNFLTQDGKTPQEISALAKQQVQQYNTVHFFTGIAAHGKKLNSGFEIGTTTGETFSAHKLVFATGVKDKMPDIKGYAECWGISAIHCPYCHGYEVRNEQTGIMGNGEYGIEFATLISNWTRDLTLYTNGKSTLTAAQTALLQQHHIAINEKEIAELNHTDGYMRELIFKDGTTAPVKALYARNPFEQHCTIPEDLGCMITEDGFIQVDMMQQTTVPGIYACGDNTTRMRTVSISVAQGTTAGMMLNKEMVMERFEDVASR